MQRRLPLCLLQKVRDLNHNQHTHTLSARRQRQLRQVRNRSGANLAWTDMGIASTNEPFGGAGHSRCGGGPAQATTNVVNVNGRRGHTETPASLVCLRFTSVGRSLDNEVLLHCVIPS